MGVLSLLIKSIPGVVSDQVVVVFGSVVSNGELSVVQN